MPSPMEQYEEKLSAALYNDGKPKSAAERSEQQKNEDKLDIGIRRLLPEDINFILHSWKLSYRAYRREWTNTFYYAEMHRRIVRLLERTPTVRVACNPLDVTRIYGWVIAENPVLHYLYVKEPFRGAGVALSLVAEVGLASASKILCTHWTAACDRQRGVLQNITL